jgi:hypothetical protein
VGLFGLAWQRIGELLDPEVRLARRVDLSPVATDPGDVWVEEVFGVLEPLAQLRRPRGPARTPLRAGRRLG